MLLTIMLLFTMDGGSIYATGLAQEPQQTQEEQQNARTAPEEGENPPEEGENPPQEGENPPEEGENPPEEGEEPPEEETRYTVIFDLDGGVTAAGTNSFTMQVKEGEAVKEDEVPKISKKGYLFQDWLDSEGNYYDFSTPVTGNITLSASWMPITYRVQFQLDGGSGEQPAELLVAYDEEIKLPMGGLYKENYVHIGWEQEGVGVYQEGASAKNLTDQDGAVVVLKAVWKRGEYKVSFQANGGTGTMSDEVFSCGKSKKLTKNKFKRTGYTFVGWNTQKDGKGKSYKQQESVSFANQADGSTVVLYAMWEGNSYQVAYDGNGAKSGSVPNTKHVYGTASKLGTSNFTRTGYTFAGWNTQKDGKGKTYANGASVEKLTADEGATVTLYAKWAVINYTITYQTRNGKMAKGAKKTYNIETKTFSLPAPTRKGYDFDGWYKDAKLKKRVGEIKTGTTGNKKYYAKWVKCTRKPSTKYTKIKACKATGTGKISVKATVKSRVASSDDRYYLVYINPYTDKPYKAAKNVYKKKNLSFTLKTSENQGYAVAKFGIAVKNKGKYKLISKTSFVSNPQKAAKNKSKYKLGATKKGMQFYNNMQEIDECGAKNNFLNMTVSSICANPTVPYQYNGKTYYFNSLDSMKQIVSECNKKGINVTMQILLDWVGDQLNLIDPSARAAGAAPYYMWNVRRDGGREKMEAIFCYLGSVFGSKQCYVSNWILGNEINNPRGWNYAGGISGNTYFKMYAHAFRALYASVRSQYSNAKVFICMDNFWNTSAAGGYSVKYSISSFVAQLGNIQKGIQWNLAYHAYSAPLTYTNFWDGYGITYDENSPYITMKNLDVLTNYIKKNYGSKVRVILSEQGYASNWGQANQAAAIAASYYIAACNPTVDAFIIRSYYDHPVEVAQGLPMGIAGKEAFEVFKYMDTTVTFQYTNRYLGLIGISSWDQLVPKYKPARLHTMYRK